jgi:hypothetical protein
MAPKIGRALAASLDGLMGEQEDVLIDFIFGDQL